MHKHPGRDADLRQFFPATSEGLEEGEPHTEKTEPEDDQDEEEEQSLAGSLPKRRQVARVHEKMGHPSNRTLVRVLRLGGTKRRFMLAAAKHRCGAREGQKRPAGPIVGRSPNFFVFSDVVGFVLFFFNTHDRHTQPAMNIVAWNACDGLGPEDVATDDGLDVILETLTGGRAPG